MLFPPGFNINALTGRRGTDNLALVWAPEGMTCAGIFTINSNPAHPVQISRKNISSSVHRAILVNKGSANAATGSEGKNFIDGTVLELSRLLRIERNEILSASTGVIGVLPSFKKDSLEKVVSLTKNSSDPEKFARAIMTTDTRPKMESVEFRQKGNKASICGIAKGSGMICPDMATMLGFIFTDAVLSKSLASELLSRAAADTFNCLNIDSETSTNDTVFLSSSGASGLEINGSNCEAFYRELQKVALGLVRQLAADGEGATRMVTVKVKGASCRENARRAARAISSSPLCKTAFHGASPNWGRIISALGAAGIKVDISKFDLDISGTEWIRGGLPNKKTISIIKKKMSGKQFELSLNLNSGTGESVSYTCDFSPEYVDINAGYVS